MLASDRIHSVSKYFSCGFPHVHAKICQLSDPVPQEPAFSCFCTGNMMRSAFFKCSVKCPETLLTVAVTAPSLTWIVLMTVDYRLESLWRVYF